MPSNCPNCALHPQLFQTRLSIGGIGEALWELAPPALRQHTPPLASSPPPLELAGEKARSKRLAMQSAALSALARWELGAWVEGLDSEDEALKESLKASRAGEGCLVAPLRASQWRGASCALVVARMLAHAAEVGVLQANLTKLLPLESVPSHAALRIATTPRAIGGYQLSNERSKWLGESVLGLELPSNCPRIALELPSNCPNCPLIAL